MRRLAALLGTHEPLRGDLLSKLWPFPAVVAATLSIAWATEIAAFFVSRAMALAILAFLEVSPEFAVEAVLARNAAQDPTQLQFVTANFTGSNRILVGLGLPLIFFIGRHVLRRQGRWPGALEFAPHHAVEILALAVPSIYSFVWVIRGSLGLVDSVFLVSIFAAYLWMLSRMPAAEESEVELLRGVPRRVMATESRTFQRNFAVGAFVLGGGLLFVSAAPFVRGMEDIGEYLHIPPYLLLQWVAPILSEFPEFFTVIYWSRQGRAEQAFMNIVAAKINQWTLLIAMIPLVFLITSAVNGAAQSAIHFDYQQRIEVLLTASQGLFAVLALFKFRFERWEAYTLLLLWGIQLFDPILDPYLQALPTVFGGVTPEGTRIIIREWTSVAYLALAAFEILRYRRQFHVLRSFRETWRMYIRPGSAPSGG
jgi:cation:H+ antiporter